MIKSISVDTFKTLKTLKQPDDALRDNAALLIKITYSVCAVGCFAFLAAFILVAVYVFSQEIIIIYVATPFMFVATLLFTISGLIALCMKLSDPSLTAV
jgi:hypothetical protein